MTTTATGTPQAGRYFEDTGWFAHRGTVSGVAAGTKVGIFWRQLGITVWHSSGLATTTSTGTFAFDQRVGYAAGFAFRAAVGGAPGDKRAAVSNEVKVTVADAYLRQNKLVPTVDSLKSPTVSGSVYPGRPGVQLMIQVRRANGVYATAATATTAADGTYRVPLAYGVGQLTTHSVRSVYRAANRPRWEFSSVSQVQRIRVLNAAITPTTSAQVAKTYRRGCPVGPSKLRTITMNYYGFDPRMHRGLLIVRSDLTGKLTRSFDAALHGGYPIAQMRNPGDYGGNDPRQMAADNTSGFNCRKVVGNPYAQSPHSYGIAIDVNTVQNPYRDRNGRWWPQNGQPYVDRTPLRRGMLGPSSTLTRRLSAEGYFWGGRWSPGKDYQHFEYRR